MLQPFQRAGADRTAHGHGLGLGLSIVEAIAAAHHANLALSPQPEGGLQIEVSFPVPNSQNTSSPHTNDEHAAASQLTGPSRPTWRNRQQR